MLRAGLAAALTLASTGLPACASDAAPEPQPQLEDPGSFVAIQNPDGSFALRRTLDRVDLNTGIILVFTVYDVRPTSWTSARDLSMQHDLPILHPTSAISEALFVSESDYRVVWYRTLTDEEEQRLK